MLVRVNEAGTHQAAGRIDDVDVDPERFDRVSIHFANPPDLAVDEQNRLLAEVLGRVHVTVFDEGQHARELRKPPASARVLERQIVIIQRRSVPRGGSVARTIVGGGGSEWGAAAWSGGRIGARRAIA